MDGRRMEGAKASLPCLVDQQEANTRAHEIADRMMTRPVEEDRRRERGWEGEGSDGLLSATQSKSYE